MDSKRAGDTCRVGNAHEIHRLQLPAIDSKILHFVGIWATSGTVAVAVRAVTIKDYGTFTQPAGLDLHSG